jgi:membrane protein
MTWRPRLGTSAARRAATTGAPPPPEDEDGAPERAPHAEQDRPDVLGPRRARLADDPALGRQAATPTQIPPPGWRAVLGRVWREASGDQIPMVAASCGFYALLALFPGISFLISLYGLLLDPVRVERQLQAVRDVVPAEAFDLIAAQVHKLAAAGSTKLTWGLALSLLVALWSCMSGTKALLTSLNIAYEEQEKRSFLRYNLQALLFTLGGVVGVTLALAIIVGVPAVLNLTWLGTGEALAVRVISFLLLLGFVMLGLAVLYRFGPSREEPRWHWVTPGSVAAAVVWVVASLLFSFYVGTLGSYDATYGPLGAVVVMLMWFWISAFVVLLGAELNAELELQTKRDTTTGPDRPMGERGAFAADHVAVG